MPSSSSEWTTADASTRDWAGATTAGSRWGREGRPLRSRGRSGRPAGSGLTVIPFGRVSGTAGETGPKTPPPFEPQLDSPRTSTSGPLPAPLWSVVVFVRNVGLSRTRIHLGRNGHVEEFGHLGPRGPCI